MKNRLGLLAISGLLSLSLLTGCNDKPEETATEDTSATEAPASDAENVLATVNGKAITREDIIAFMQYKQQIQPNAQVNPALLLNEMINTRLLVAEAEAKGLQETDEVKRQLQIQRAAALVNVLVRDYLETLDLSDPELKKEFDNQLAGVDKKEFKASHILVENEETARKLIAEIKADASNFAELAKANSTGPSGKDGGDLGWFSTKSMVPEFGDAVEGMNKGDVSKNPVQSEFGWHIIYLEDVREIDLPSFEESKPRLELIVAQRKLQEHIAELREKATIEIKGMDAPAEAAPSAPAEPPLEADQPVSNQ